MLYPELRNAKRFTIEHRSQKAKVILLADHGIAYSNHMAHIDKKQAAAILNEFRCMNQYDMKDDALR